MPTSYQCMWDAANTAPPPPNYSTSRGWNIVAGFGPNPESSFCVLDYWLAANTHLVTYHIPLKKSHLSPAALTQARTLVVYQKQGREKSIFKNRRKDEVNNDQKHHEVECAYMYSLG
jgi:hypothetical protein